MARKKMRNWIAVAILFFSLVAIVVTGFGTGGGGGIDSLRGGGGTGTELATVGGVAITTTQANDQFNRDFQNFQRGNEGLPNVQIGEFLNQNGFEGAVDRLINVEAIRQFAAARGLRVTRQMIDDAIYNAPDFRFARIGDTFDNNLFRQRLQQAGYTVERLRGEIGEQLLQQQLLSPVTAGFSTPRGVAEAYALVPAEERSGVVGEVPLAAIESTFNPTQAQVAAYYDQYKRYFAVPERRVIKYAVIGPQQVTVAPITDAEIQAVYNATPRYQAGQIRTLESVNFGSSASAQADANTFAQRVRGGTALQAAAQAAGRGDAYARRADQRQQDFANLVTPEVARQAFSAAQGAIIGPVRTSVGWLVVRVDSAAGGQTLAAVRPAIVRELERRKNSAAISALVAQLEQQINDGASFEDAASGARLTVVTAPPLTAQGRLSNGRPWAQLSPELRAILPAAFEMDPEDSQPQVPPIEENGRYALLGIERAEPAAAPPLAEIYQQVRFQLVRQTARVRARQIADAIAARINGGMAPAQAFAQAGLPLQPPRAITTRRGTIMAAQAPAALRLFFRLRPGSAGVIASPGGTGWMIAVPQRSVRGSSPEQRIVQDAQQQLNLAAASEAESQFIRSLAERIGAQRNTGAIASERRRIAHSMGAAPQE
jgi:peptidyl-prolyl cis-trans isomerase D